jgi:hypothetical protein
MCIDLKNLQTGLSILSLLNVYDTYISVGGRLSIQLVQPLQTDNPRYNQLVALGWKSNDRQVWTIGNDFAKSETLPL